MGKFKYQLIQNGVVLFEHYKTECCDEARRLKLAIRFRNSYRFIEGVRVKPKKRKIQNGKSTP